MSAPDRTRRLAAGALLLLSLAVAGGLVAAELTDALAALEPAPEVPLREDVDEAVGAGGDPAGIGRTGVAGAGTATCPAIGDGETPARLVVVADGEDPDEESLVTVERFVDGEAQTHAEEAVTPDSPLVVELDGAQAAAPVAVRWRGAPVAAAWLVDRRPSAAAACDPHPQPISHVAGFDTTLESDATLHLTNPYASDAVVRVTFATPAGPSALVRTDNVLVPAHGHTSIDVADVEPEHAELGATVEVLAGRVFAQGEASLGTPEEQEGPEGTELLPAVADPDPGQRLATADAHVGDDASSWLVVTNLEEREASFELAVSDPIDGAPRLLGETGVPAGGAVRVDLDDVSESTEFAVSIDPVGDTRLVATRLTAVTTEEGGQDISASPLRPPAPSWTVAGGRAGTGRLAVHNPGDEPAVVSIGGPADRPDGWSAVEVPASGRVAVDLDELPGDAPVSLHVRADEPVVTTLGYRAGDDELALWSLEATDTAAWRATTVPPTQRDTALPGRLAPLVPDDTDIKGFDG